jgi:hypothetical protein
MSARKAVAVFLGWLIVAFFVVALITIYGFNYFESALGGQADNLFLSMAFYAALALAITAGFAGFLMLRRSNRQSFQGVRLLIAAAIACGLFHGIALAGPLFDYVGSWELRLAIVAAYSVIVGALVAAGLIRSTKVSTYAA